MKQILYKILFKKNIKEINQLYEQNSFLYNQINELKSQNEDYLQLINEANRLVEIGYELYSLKKTKYGEWVICYGRTTTSSVDGTINYEFYISPIYSTEKVLMMFIEHDKAKKHLDIIDIQMSEKNCSKGYGTIAMERLFHLVDNWRIERITGMQYYESYENKQRQDRYYQKFCFRIVNGALIWDKEKDLHPFKETTS
ncbi:hypothetical protein [Anoxybacteroides rupiense]|uniref:hypothetical protein n=1 Tax=Anoxybacteroides rupiense TaxID=311460 RepID=UPI00366A9CEA